MGMIAAKINILITGFLVISFSLSLNYNSDPNSKEYWLLKRLYHVQYNIMKEKKYTIKKN